MTGDQYRPAREDVEVLRALVKEYETCQFDPDAMDAVRKKMAPTRVKIMMEFIEYYRKDDEGVTFYTGDIRGLLGITSLDEWFAFHNEDVPDEITNDPPYHADDTMFLIYRRNKPPPSRLR